jgi:thiamine-phosphate pyrophosphorylase
MRQFPPLYAVADATFGDPVDLSRRLFRAGVQLLQIRNKGASSGTFLNEAIQVVEDAPKGAVVIVNDRADIARLSGASGVHLGQTDLPPTAARGILGHQKILGISTHDAVQAAAALRQPVDYLAVGPIFETRTKKDHEPVIGLNRLAEICDEATVPVVAIGGIQLENLDDVFAAGASAVAVISDLIGNENVEARAHKFLETIAGIRIRTSQA